MLHYSLAPVDGQQEEEAGRLAPRTVVECLGDIAVTRFDDGDRQVIRLSDDYGQRVPGEDFSEADYRPVALGTCCGVLIVMKDARSARTIERAARIAAEKLEAPCSTK